MRSSLVRKFTSTLRASSDADLLRIAPGPSHRSRYGAHYQNTLSSDLLYLTYDHQLTTNPPQPPEIPAWDTKSPFARNRPRPRTRARIPPGALSTDDQNLVKLETVALSIHVRDGPSNKNSILPALQFLRAISGYHAAGLPNTHLKQAAEPAVHVTRTTKKAASFKVRDGQPCGAKVVLMGPSAYDFIETTVDFVLPRLKDWDGIVLPAQQRADIMPTATSGSFSFGLPTQAMALYPQVEVNIDRYPVQFGMHISCTTNARGPGAQDRVRALLSGLRLPRYLIMNDDDGERPYKRVRLDDNSALIGVLERHGDFDRLCTEEEVGITNYVDASTAPIHGIIKHRFTDFLVHEVDLSGKVTKLTDIDPPEGDQVVVEPSYDATVEPDWESQEATSIKALTGPETCSQLQDLYKAGKTSKQTVSTPDIATKQDRTNFHQAVRQLFQNQFATETKTVDDCSSIVIRWQSGNKGRSSRPPARPKDDRPPFLHFTLHKINRETMDALTQISTFLHVPMHDLSVCGTKDKRSASTQRVSLKRGRRSAHLVWQTLRGKKGPRFMEYAGVRGVQVGNFDYASSALELGKIFGNRFTITLRGLQTTSSDDILKAVANLQQKGFINYYGMQRFGTSTVPSHAIGVALLKGDWQTATRLIMYPKGGDNADAEAARLLWNEKRDAAGALKLMPRSATAERALLAHFKNKGHENESDHFAALATIPRNLKMMYIHAYQSYLWNTMASHRIRLLGNAAAEGDLVYSDAVTEPSETFDNDVDKHAATIPKVRALDTTDLAKHDIFDVVLPIPGHIVSYPPGVLDDIYRSMLAADGLDPDNMRRKQPEYSMAGTYRKLMHKPTDVTCKLLRYDDLNTDLALTDDDILQDRQLSGISDDGKHLALQIEMTLGTSSYATMALREVLKCSTSSQSQKELTQAMQSTDQAIGTD